MAKSLPLTDDLTPEELPVAPTAEQWASMSPIEQERFLEDACAALDRERLRLGEGAPHTHARVGAWLVLREHFRRAGRSIYLGSNMPVVYPGERVFEPDLFAVLDLTEPAVDTRMNWIVMREGRGIDLALEVLHAGNRQKDLAGNVVDYARLGVREYFVYDRLKLRLYGYRLPQPGARTYEPVSWRGGVLHSEVLGLDLRLEGVRIRFSQADALILETSELLDRANALVDELQVRADEEAARAYEAAARAEEASRQVAEVTRRAEEASRQLAEVTRRAEALAARLRALGVDPDA